MWIFTFLPTWVFHAILGAGILALLAGMFFSFIPIISKYNVPVKVVGYTLVAFGLFLEGGLNNNIDNAKARILTTGLFTFNPRMSVATGTEITTGINVCDDVWHNIVFTYQRDNGNMKCYVDGVLQQTQTDYPINGGLSFASTSVGAKNTAYGPVTFVQDLLTDAEVLALYNSAFVL
jgi:hypothetical protein